MSEKDFFPPRPGSRPSIYAYALISGSTHFGLLKIGFTDRDAKTRIKEQLDTAAIQYKIVFEESAMKSDGGSFTDHDIHRYLRIKGFANPEGEWFKCTVKDLQAAIWAMKSGKKNEDNRTLTFAPRA
jgi:hypothetical protein